MNDEDTKPSHMVARHIQHEKKCKCPRRRGMVERPTDDNIETYGVPILCMYCRSRFLANQGGWRDGRTQGDFGDPCRGVAISTLADIKTIDWMALPLVACRSRGSSSKAG